MLFSLNYENVNRRKQK